MSAKGIFIVFEGIDGAGKTTQVDLLAQNLASLGREVSLSAEPTTLATGKAIRRALSGEEKKSECEMAAMFVLDRIAHNINSETGIRALTERGIDVISDRYYYSSLAYQGTATDYEWVKTMNINSPEIRRPDLCIYLDLLPEESLERISRGRESLEIYENLEKLTAVRAKFLSVVEDLRRDGESIYVVNAARAAEDIAKEIFEIVKKHI
ncbi:MAG: dTMP kinase [Clostridia bacterium]|nr:dTMP kinase [Clostridia bacterium]MBR2613302.1 dTMP kinase [Clostridia bacterium]